MQSGMKNQTEPTYLKSTPPQDLLIPPQVSTPLPLNVDSILGKCYEGELNPIAPNVKLTWGIIENNQVNLIVDLCWCRDFLLWWLANIAKPKLPRFKERSFAIKDLLLVMRLYDSYGNIPVRDKLKNGLRYLHQIETDFGLETTKVIPVDKKEYIVIKGDPFWTKTTLHAGFWTLILRTCMHKDCPDQFTEKDICTIFNKDQAIKYDLALNVVELRYSDIFKYFPKILYNLRKVSKWSFGR